MHFQTVLEHFSPYDSVIKASTPQDLNENTLNLKNASPDTPAKAAAMEGTPNLFNTENATAGDASSNQHAEVSGILARLHARRTSLLPVKDSEPSNDTKPLVTSEKENERPVSARNGDDQTILPGSEPRWQVEDLDGTKQNGSNENFSLRGQSPSREHFREGSFQDFRPKTSDSVTSSSFQKFKIRYFARPVDEDGVIEERERSKLPAGMRIKPRESEAVPIPAKSPRRPKSSREHRSSRPHRHRSSKSAEKPTADFSHSKDTTTVPAETDQLALPAIPPALASGTVESRNPATTDPKTLVPKVSQSSMNSLKKQQSTMTPERMRLLKALQIRKRQQEAAALSKDGGTLDAAPASASPAVETLNSATSAGPAENSGHVEGVGKPQAEEEIANVKNSAIDEVITNGQAEAVPDQDVQNDPSVHPTDQTKSGDGTPAEDKLPTHAPVQELVQALHDPPPEAQVSAESPQLPSTSTDDGRADSVLAVPVTGSPNGSQPDTGKKSLLVPSPITARSDKGIASDSSDNMSIIDDLHNATLGEAMAVAVPQTPIRTGFGEQSDTPRSPNSPESKPGPSTAQSELYHSASRQNSNTPKAEPVSAGRALSPPTIVTVKPSKRTNVSSGISRRIQALEERSQRSSSPSSAPRSPSNLELPSTFLTTSRLADQNHSRNTSGVSRPSSKGSSRQGTIRGLFRPMDSIEDTTPRMSTENLPHVSVTARIVRQAGQENADKTDKNKKAEPEFQQSHVIVEREGAPSRFPFRRVDRPSSVMSRPESRGSSFSAIGRSSMDIGFKFIGRKRAENKSPSLPDQAVGPSVSSLERVEEDVEEKKQSRTSRFLKRMSGLSSSSRKATSDGGENKSLDSREVKTSHQQLRVSRYIIGDLNVQFPDTLVSMTWAWDQRRRS